MNNNNTLERSTPYKVRRSGNSDIVTIPAMVKEKLGLTDGDSIAFAIENDTVTIVKEEPEVNVDQIIDNVMDQYDSLLSKLVEL